MTQEEEKKAKQKAYYEANKERILAKKKEYEKNNAEQIKAKKKEYDKEYRENNKDKQKELNKEYYQKTKVKRKIDYELKKNDIDYQNEKKAKNRQYQKERRLNDPLYKLTRNIRTLINYSLKIKGVKKLSKTELILGCSFQDFKEHLESQFEDWMTWDNYGNWNGISTEPNTAWDIDHIIPNSKGMTEKEILNLNHYSNLKPLCSYYNRYIKKDNI